MKIKISYLFFVLAYIFVGFFSNVLANDYTGYRYILGDIDEITSIGIDQKFNYPDINLDLNLCDGTGSVEINGTYERSGFGLLSSDITCTGGTFVDNSGNNYTIGNYEGGSCVGGYFTGYIYYNLGYCTGGTFVDNQGNEYTGGKYVGGTCKNGRYKNGENAVIFLGCSAKQLSVKDLYFTGSRLFVNTDLNFSSNKIYQENSSYIKIYDNGKHYVFSNVDTISSEIDFANGGSITYIDDHILSYNSNTKKFLVKDVCENNDCSISNVSNIGDKELSYDDFVSGVKIVRNLKNNITTEDLLAENNLFLFKSTSVPQTEYIAGDNLGDVKIGLLVNLPYNTVSGDRFEYEYIIFLKDLAGNSYEVNKDKFVIANSGGVLGIYGYKYDDNGCIKDASGECKLYDINTVFDGVQTEISMIITGSFEDVALVKIIEKGSSVQKAGTFNFGVKLSIGGLSQTPISVQKVGDLQITVAPGDISSSNSIIKLTTNIPNDKIISNHEIVHFKGNSDILNFSAYLKDNFGNDITNRDVNICYNDKVKIDNYDNNYSLKCKTIKYNGGYNFRMYFIDYGKFPSIYMDVDGKSIPVKWKDATPLTINVISNSSALAGGYYDTFVCTNKDIHYVYKCNYDLGPAGCYLSMKRISTDSDGNISSINNCVGSDCNVNIDFTFNSENQNAYGDPVSALKPIYVMDNAGNVVKKLYLMSHIDKTTPRISIADNLYTSDKFLISIDDTSSSYPSETSYPGGCRESDGKIKFLMSSLIVKRNGSIIYNRSNYSKELLTPKGSFIFEDTTNNIFYKKPGEYTISLSIKDKAGNQANINKIIKILPNTDFSMIDDNGNPGITITSDSSYADGYTVFTGWFRLVDSYGNNIYGNYYPGYPFADVNNVKKLIKNISIVDNGVLLNELSNQDGGFSIIGTGFNSSNGKFYISFVVYNDKLKTPIKLKVDTNTFDVNGNIDYVNTRSFTVLINGGIKSIFKPGKVYSYNGTEIGNHNGFILSGVRGYVPAFGQDIPIILGAYTDNFNNPYGVRDLSFNINFWAVKGDNCNLNRASNVNVTAGSGYEAILAKLTGNYGYGVGNLYSNSYTGLKISIRLEKNGGDGTTNYKLCGSGFVQYSINGADGSRIIKKKVNWISNILVKYWGVYVEGSYSNSVKGLYEILRNSSSNYSMSRSNQNISNLKIKTYNKIIKNAAKLIKGVEQKTTNIYTNIEGIYYNNGDIDIEESIIKKKSLIYAEGGNVVIKGNIKKKGGILTIVATSKNGKGGYIFIDNGVTNIDAILVSEKGIFPLSAKKLDGTLNNSELIKIVKGDRNSQLNNQLLIYGMVISRGNTIGGSIKIGGKYVLPGGKYLLGTTTNFYRSAIYDLNYLRRYHSGFNPGKVACSSKSSDYSSSCSKLDTGKYGTYPVIIKTDSSIRVSKPYGF